MGLARSKACMIAIKTCLQKRNWCNCQCPKLSSKSRDKIWGSFWSSIDKHEANKCIIEHLCLHFPGHRRNTDDHSVNWSPPRISSWQFETRQHKVVFTGAHRLALDLYSKNWILRHLDTESRTWCISSSCCLKYSSNISWLSQLATCTRAKSVWLTSTPTQELKFQTAKHAGYSQAVRSAGVYLKFTYILFCLSLIKYSHHIRAPLWCRRPQIWSKGPWPFVLAVPAKLIAALKLCSAAASLPPAHRL